MLKKLTVILCFIMCICSITVTGVSARRRGKPRTIFVYLNKVNYTNKDNVEVSININSSDKSYTDDIKCYGSLEEVNDKLAEHRLKLVNIENLVYTSTMVNLDELQQFLKDDNTTIKLLNTYGTDSKGISYHINEKFVLSIVMCVSIAISLIYIFNMYKKGVNSEIEYGGVLTLIIIVVILVAIYFGTSYGVSYVNSLN